jgi:hypothetical protein
LSPKSCVVELEAELVRLHSDFRVFGERVSQLIVNFSWGKVDPADFDKILKG